MNFQKVKRMAAAAGVMVAAGALPILVASPASASQSACTNYVASHGYFAGPKVKAACDYPALDTGLFKIGHPACLLGLEKIGVKSEVSNQACKRA
ncbi:hypothetical protein ACWDUC_25655 [Streptomyces tricolor]|uniref:Secreted protein n=1 Tax=Streptomyces tricolor TaxID=68277 RepID=A0ABS9JEM0_9ACTN|nr:MULTISPECIES: hypothetical protein [Streptomyces]MCG0064026.1 hypothetical protein [Streptomyces tricolor]OYP17610.1 hypothetical protein CFC35_26475 [Streptomyces sp. FBKL.4005]